jgi:hypothetical protein
MILAHEQLNDSACKVLMKPVIMDREELVRTALHFQMLQHPYPQQYSH